MRGNTDDHAGAADGPAGAARGAWTFLTNHASVLLCIARDPTMRLRDVASEVGITERATQSIVADLVTDGYLTRTRVGRRNHYEVHRQRPLRRSDATQVHIGGLLDFLQGALGLVTIGGPSAALATASAHGGNGHHVDN